MSHFFSAATVNSVGLALDILGVILLFCYGLPPDVHPGRGGDHYPLGRRRYSSRNRRENKTVQAL